MLDNGWDTAVTAASTETYVYNVPSENNQHVVYRVCPAEQFCNCLAGTRGRTCKRLILFSLLTCGDGEIFPDMDTQLQAHANNLIQKNKYIISTKPHKTLEVESLFGRAVSKPCIVTNVCDCCTFSYHKKCACLLLAKGLLTLQGHWGFKSTWHYVDILASGTVSFHSREKRDIFMDSTDSQLQFGCIENTLFETIMCVIM